MPDQVKDFNATDNITGQWGKDVFNWQHSLHGGSKSDIALRRESLVSLLKGKSLSRNWERGFVIHALGDAYAHTYDNDSKAYGHPRGHAWDNIRGNSPDVIARSFARYEEYVKELYLALGGNGKPEDNPKIAKILETAQQLPTSQDDAVALMEALARDPKHFSYSYRYRPVEGGYNLDVNNNKPPSKEDV